jgi:uncharacterized protein (DUF433 family)
VESGLRPCEIDGDIEKDFAMSKDKLPTLNAPLPEFLSVDVYGYVHLAGHRIGLQSLVRCYNNGYSPEMMACEYPTLSLATIHKVIGFYLENRCEVDRYVAECDADMEMIAAVPRHGPTVEELRERLAKIQLAKQV